MRVCDEDESRTLACATLSYVAVFTDGARVADYCADNCLLGSSSNSRHRGTPSHSNDEAPSSSPKKNKDTAAPNISYSDEGPIPTCSQSSSSSLSSDASSHHTTVCRTLAARERRKKCSIVYCPHYLHCLLFLYITPFFSVSLLMNECALLIYSNCQQTYDSKINISTKKCSKTN